MIDAPGEDPKDADESVTLSKAQFDELKSKQAKGEDDSVTLSKAQFDELTGKSDKGSSADDLIARQIIEKSASDRRKKALADAIQYKVRYGWRVESQGDFSASLVRGRRVNHLLHFFIGLFTFGVWWLVWIFIVMTGGERRQAGTVSEDAKVIWGKEAKG